MLLLTLPGAAFVYQGDEIGMVDGAGADPPIDRAGRDPHRHPMQWEPEPRGGFTEGEPWLELIDPERRASPASAGDPARRSSIYRELIVLRRELGGEFELLDADAEVLAYRRGAHIIALNLGDEPRRPPPGMPRWRPRRGIDTGVTLAPRWGGAAP